MANAKDWAVSTTTFSMERHWGIRVEWFGFEYLLAVTVNSAPAIRIVIFGVSLYAGRLLEPPKACASICAKLQRARGGFTKEERSEHRAGRHCEPAYAVGG